MATTFLEPGGDGTFLLQKTTNGLAFWLDKNATVPTIATDFVHGGHLKSISPNTTAAGSLYSPNGIVSDAGSRISFYVYFNTLPDAATKTSIFALNKTGFGSQIVILNITSGGVLQLWNTSTAQIGSDGSHTLSTGKWYRISLAYTITSTTVNRFELFVDGSSDISITNATITNTTSSQMMFGKFGATFTGDYRLSDIYVDNSASLTDTGDIWVTAKRPVSNGTTNGFSTQIGAGGSGYGSGHSPQVNERALSTTNGWSMVGAGSAVTEEYNIEAKNVGDIDVSTATIVAKCFWVSTSSLVGENSSIVYNGSTQVQAITSTPTIYTIYLTSTSYPAGTGADIGIITDTSLTTVSLYECGVIVAYIPATGGTTFVPTPTLAFMGVG